MIKEIVFTVKHSIHYHLLQKKEQQNCFIISIIDAVALTKLSFLYVMIICIVYCTNIWNPKILIINIKIYYDHVTLEHGKKIQKKM